jgi:hypothetical protein
MKSTRLSAFNAGGLFLWLKKFPLLCLPELFFLFKNCFGACYSKQLKLNLTNRFLLIFWFAGE